MENSENKQLEELEVDADFAKTEAEEPGNDPAEEEYVPKNRYERVLYSVYKNETLAPILAVLSYVIVGIAAYAFI